MFLRLIYLAGDVIERRRDLASNSSAGSGDRIGDHPRSNDDSGCHDYFSDQILIFFHGSLPPQLPISYTVISIPCSASNSKRLRGIQIIIKGSLNGCPLKIAFCCPAGGALYPARRACGEARPSGVEHVFVQAAEGLLHPGERQCQIHADVARAVEGTAVPWGLETSTPSKRRAIKSQAKSTLAVSTWHSSSTHS